MERQPASLRVILAGAGNGGNLQSTGAIYWQTSRSQWESFMRKICFQWQKVGSDIAGKEIILLF